MITLAADRSPMRHREERLTVRPLPARSRLDLNTEEVTLLLDAYDRAGRPFGDTFAAVVLWWRFRTWITRS